MGNLLGVGAGNSEGVYRWEQEMDIADLIAKAVVFVGRLVSWVSRPFKMIEAGERRTTPAKITYYTSAPPAKPRRRRQGSV